MGPHPRHLHWAISKAGKDGLHRANSVGTSHAPIFKMVQHPRLMWLPFWEFGSPNKKLHRAQTQGSRFDQWWKIEVWGIKWASWGRDKRKRPRKEQDLGKLQYQKRRYPLPKSRKTRISGGDGKLWDAETTSSSTWPLQVNLILVVIVVMDPYYKKEVNI